MREEAATFYSDELKLEGRYFWPDDAVAGAAPLVVICSGFTGLCAIHPARFARYLTRRGWACFGFDYRGFGASDGKRGWVLLEEQVRDITHGLSLVASDQRVCRERIYALGWGMGAGLVLAAARRFDALAGLICANGFYNGARVQAHHRGAAGLSEFEAFLAAERARRVRDGDSKFVDPFDLYPLDAQSRQYVDDVLRKTPGYQGDAYATELGESLLEWDAESLADGLELPLLIAHGAENRLHPPSEAEALAAAYAGECELFWLEDAGHTEFMLDDDPRFEALGARIHAWLEARA